METGKKTDPTAEKKATEEKKEAPTNKAEEAAKKETSKEASPVEKSAPSGAAVPAKEKSVEQGKQPAKQQTAEAAQAQPKSVQPTKSVAESSKDAEKKEAIRKEPLKKDIDKNKVEEKKKDLEAEARKRRAAKRKKLKEKKKQTKEEEEKERNAAFRQGQPQAKAGAGKGKVPPPAKGRGKGYPVPGRFEPKKQPIDDDVEVDYIVPEVLEGSGMENAMGFAGVRERFKFVEPAPKQEDADDTPAAPKKRQKPKASLLEEAEDSEDDDEQHNGRLSKKKRKFSSRMSVAELKTLVKRPDVVEVWDTTSADPRLLVYLKAYRNTVNVPKHWSSKRKYMAGKRGVEKPPFKLPEFIEATGIAKIRQSILEKQEQNSLKQKSRNRAHPKMGKLDIDYQVLHDAFFKFANKPKLSKHNDLYHEGKEYEAKMMTKRPGQLSAALKEALGMAENAPPPWLINMQRYGPPPAYPNLKIPGLNAPIPQGAEYGYHPGGWGKPPIDELGNPQYGDWRPSDNAATPAQQAEDSTLWGEVDDFDDDDDDDDAEGAEKADGVATPMLGTSTPLVGSGSATPIVSMQGGVHSISGVSSITSGMDTPSGSGNQRSKRGGIASVSGVSSASLTPTPQLFQVLEEQKARSNKGLHPSSHTYKMRSKTGSSTPIAGVGSSGTGTPLAGIGTPVGGIGTPHGISTPHGIGTPGMGTGTPGVGTRTPHGIGTPVSAHGTGSAGIGTGTHTPHGVGTRTPHGIGTPHGGIGTPHGGGIATPVGGIATPVGGIATPVGGIATPVGGIATPVGGIATPVGGIATPLGGIATPVGGVATPTGIPGAMVPTPVGGADTPGPVTMALNPQDVETEGILTADIIRQQLKQHEEAAAKAKLAAGQKEVEPRKGPAREKKRKDKTKFKF